MGAMDQDVTPRTSIRFPGLYYPGLAKLWFSRKVFSNFAIHGLVTSLVLIGTIMGKVGRPRMLSDFSLSRFFVNMYDLSACYIVSLS